MKHIKLDGKSLPYNKNTHFLVQVGKGNKGKYSTHYAFEGDFHKALFYYQSINVGYGYKKRLVVDGKLLTRCFS